MPARPRPPPVLTRPPIREVRAALRQMGPDVQSCADQTEPPGTGSRRRLRMRVWLEPNGRWSLEVPELEVRPGSAILPTDRMGRGRLRSCLQIALTRRIAQYVRGFRGVTRQKVERAFVVTMPGPPPSEAVLARRVTGRRQQLLACVPGAGTSGVEAELVVRATLTADGAMQLTGLAIPDQVSFETAATCVVRELSLVENERVTLPRDFEVVIPYRFTSGS